MLLSLVVSLTVCVRALLTSRFLESETFHVHVAAFA